MNSEIRPFHINEQEIQECVDYSELIAALDEMHRGATVEVADLLLSGQPSNGNINHFSNINYVLISLCIFNTSSSNYYSLR